MRARIERRESRVVTILDSRLSTLEERVAQRRAQPLQEGGVQQEGLHLRRLAGQDLLQQVVEDVAVGPGEPGEKPAATSVRSRSDRAAICSPATQPSVRSSSSRDRSRIQPEPHHAVQELARLRRR